MRPQIAIWVAATCWVGALAGAAVLGQEPDEVEQLLEQARPGIEHEALMALAGDWDLALVPAGSERPSATGSATARALLGGRFLDVELVLGEDERRTELRYTLGFDRRHDEYSLILIDTEGTYAITARGPAQDGSIRMLGTDDDPYMASLGLEKKFAFDLELSGASEFALALYFVDTRTEDETVHPAYRHVFTR